MFKITFIFPRIIFDEFDPIIYSQYYLKSEAFLAISVSALVFSQTRITFNQHEKPNFHGVRAAFHLY